MSSWGRDSRNVHMRTATKTSRCTHARLDTSRSWRMEESLTLTKSTRSLSKLTPLITQTEKFSLSVSELAAWLFDMKAMKCSNYMGKLTLDAIAATARWTRTATYKMTKTSKTLTTDTHTISLVSTATATKNIMVKREFTNATFEKTGSILTAWSQKQLRKCLSLISKMSSGFWCAECVERAMGVY